MSYKKNNQKIRPVFRQIEAESHDPRAAAVARNSALRLSVASSHKTASPVSDNVTAADLVRLCGVSERTARRWRAGGRMPAGLAAWCAVAVSGDLGAVDARWKGWNLRPDGLLYGPDLASGFAPGDILAVPFLRMQVRHHQQRERLPQQADFVAQRWEPLPAYECGQRPGPAPAPAAVVALAEPAQDERGQ